MAVQFDAPVQAFTAPARPYAVPTRTVVGIDHGLTSLATWSEGEKIEPPRFARKAEKHIRRLNRQRDRRRLDSGVRRRTVTRLAKAHSNHICRELVTHANGESRWRSVEA